MAISPFLSAPFVIQLHAIAAILAFLTGCVQLVRRKGDIWHRRIGWIWVGLMAITALSSFGIQGFRVLGPFSPLHLLSLLTLWALIGAIRAARLGDIRRHRQIMMTLFLFALVLAGGFTLWPGRLMHRILIGG